MSEMLCCCIENRNGNAYVKLSSLCVKLLNSFIDRGMLSSAVQPPTTEHIYAQWKEREEFLSEAPLGLLQEDSEQSSDVKDEETINLMSGGPISQNHFRTSRVVRLKGTAVTEQDKNSANSSFCSIDSFVFAGKRGRLSKADFDTGWCNDDDERQCSLCQKYGDLKPNVRNAKDVRAT